MGQVLQCHIYWTMKLADVAMQDLTPFVHDPFGAGRQISETLLNQPRIGTN